MKRPFKKTLATYRDFWNWLKNPDEQPSEISTRAKVLKTSKILFLTFISAIPFGIMLSYIHNNIYRLEQTLKPTSLLNLLLFTIVFAPLLEELFFRFPLLYKRNYLARGLSKLTNGKIRRNWSSKYRYFVYSMATIFGLVHLTNYRDAGIVLLLLAPVIIGSQLIGGLGFSYVRVKFGFIWALISHSLYNAVITLLLLGAHNTPIIQMSDTRADISITSLQYVDSNKSSLDIDKRDDRIYSIKANDYRFQEVLNEISNTTLVAYDDAWVDINFESTQGLTLNEFIDLIETEVKFFKR